MARFGEPVSRALALDLAAGGGALRNSRETAEIFLPGGRPLRQQDMLVQLDLAVTLGRLRGDGIGALYAGPMARQLVEAAARAGVAIDPARLRDALPKWSPVTGVEYAHHLWAVAAPADRKSVGEGKSGSVRVDIGGRSLIKKKK